LVLSAGYPTIAYLARHKRWPALKNLIRRQVVWNAEYYIRYEGKTAAEWARSYSAYYVAQELEYYVRIYRPSTFHKLSLFRNQISWLT
jgi:hypothetical protein